MPTWKPHYNYGTGFWYVVEHDESGRERHSKNEWYNSSDAADAEYDAVEWDEWFTR